MKPRSNIYEFCADGYFYELQEGYGPREGSGPALLRRFILRNGREWPEAMHCTQVKYGTGLSEEAFKACVQSIEAPRR